MKFDDVISQYTNSSGIVLKEDSNALMDFFRAINQGTKSEGRTKSNAKYDPEKNYYVLIDSKKNITVLERKINGIGVAACEADVNSEFNKIISNLYSTMPANPTADDLSKMHEAGLQSLFSDVNLKRKALAIKVYNSFYVALTHGARHNISLSEISTNTIHRTGKEGNPLQGGKTTFSEITFEKNMFYNEETHNEILSICKPTGVVDYMTPEQFQVYEKGTLWKQGKKATGNLIANTVKEIPKAFNSTVEL